MLIVIVLIGAFGGYRKIGEGYSAGRGIFKNSDYDLNESNGDISDYDPWEFKNMRK